MQSEDFDKKIRDAADNHHPSYDEKAWTRMEKLLDKHLPAEKKNKRRFIFLLLCLLLLGGGTWLIISPPWKQSSTLSQTKTSEPVKPADESSASSSSSPAEKKQGGSLSSTDSDNPPVVINGGLPPSKDNPVITINGKPVATDNKQSDASKTRTEDFDLTVNRPASTKKKNKQQDNDIDIATNTPARSAKKNNKAIAKTTTVTDNSQTAQGKDVTDVTAAPVDNKVSPPPADDVQAVVPPDAPASKPATSADDKKLADKKEKETAAPVVTEKKNKKDNTAKKKNKTNENGLYLTASAGPDISAVGFDRIGKVRPVYGAGLAYTFAKQFTLRTGFYTASKIYSAGPKDYKTSWAVPTPQYLDVIDASCKVYEIPVTLAWQFVRKKNHNFFGAAGVSTYLMKKEEYDYVYKYPGGTTWTYDHTFNNENKHLFSVLSLSGGYTRKLSKVFSVTAEPYLKLPLSGVGAGKVKLNSAGMLITVNAKLTGNK